MKAIIVAVIAIVAVLLATCVVAKAETTEEPTVLTPRIQGNIYELHCQHTVTDADRTSSNLFWKPVNVDEDNPKNNTGYIPALIDGKWEPILYGFHRDRVYCILDNGAFANNHHVEAIAIGIDSRMTEADISGSPYVELNSAGTGWLFKHTKTGTHHDITLSVKDGVYASFRSELDGLNSEILNLDPRDAPHARKVAEYTALVSLQD